MHMIPQRFNRLETFLVKREKGERKKERERERVKVWDKVTEKEK